MKRPQESPGANRRQGAAPVNHVTTPSAAAEPDDTLRQGRGTHAESARSPSSQHSAPSQNSRLNQGVLPFSHVTSSRDAASANARYYSHHNNGSRGGKFLDLNNEASNARNSFSDGTPYREHHHNPHLQFYPAAATSGIKDVSTHQNSLPRRTVTLHDLVHSRSSLQHKKTKEITAQEKALIGQTLRNNQQKRKRDHHPADWQNVESIWSPREGFISSPAAQLNSALPSTGYRNQQPGYLFPPSCSSPITTSRTSPFHHMNDNQFVATRSRSGSEVSSNSRGKMSSGTHALGKRSVSPLYINKAQKKRRISSENSSPSFKVPIHDIPQEIWTVILFHIAPPQSYYNLCLVSKSFYNSIRHNELYWEFQCFHCLKVTKHSLYRAVANDGIGSAATTAQRDAPSSLPSHQNSFPERGAQNAPSPTPNPSASIPQPPTWFETYKFHHLRLMRPPSDEDWLSKANDLADQELFFYSLHFYNRALQNNPNDALTTACIGDLFYKHYLHRSSFDYLHAAIEKHDLSPEQAPWAYRQLSHLYRDALGTRSRNITKAVSLLKSSIELTNDVDAMYELGDLYDELRLKANAERKDHCKLFDESSSDDSHRSPNSNSPGSSSAGSSEDSSSTGKSVPSMVSSDSSTNRGSAPSMNSEPESGTANGEAQSLSDAGKSAPSSDEARPMSTKSYNSAASSCPPESTSTPKTALASSGEDSGAILSSDPSTTTTQQLPNVRELKKRIGSSAQASGNQSSSSDSQSVAPKVRIRMKDRYRRNPSNSSRFLLRDSSSSSESSSPESDETRTLKGVNSEKLFKMAVHWFEMAASYGDTESMFELANMYSDTSPKRASWLKKAGDLGHKDALNDLAVMYELGQGGIQKDLTKAFEYYQQSAAAGSIDGMTNAGLMYEFGKGIQRDYARSIEMYKMAAEKGSARAMKNIGVMYELGRGVNRNYEQAVKWYQKAASHNETDAMVYLGTMAASGKGMVRDYRVALKWFRTVLNEHQDTVVYPYLGYMYIHGYGTKRRIQKGIQYLELSALKHEDATGQYMLGEVFHNGIPMHVEPDRTKAKELFEKAAKQEDQDATLHLSYYYSRGIACQKSEPKGHRIFEQVVEEIGVERCLEIADNIFRGESMYMLDQEYSKFIWSLLAERMGNRLAKHRLMQAVQGAAANDENQ